MLDFILETLEEMIGSKASGKTILLTVLALTLGYVVWKYIW